MYLSICLSMYVSIYVCMYVSIYLSINLYICMYTYIHINISRPRVAGAQRASGGSQRRPGVPHGGSRHFRQKSICLHAIDSRALFSAILVT